MVCAACALIKCTATLTRVLQHEGLISWRETQREHRVLLTQVGSKFVQWCRTPGWGWTLSSYLQDRLGVCYLGWPNVRMTVTPSNTRRRLSDSRLLWPCWSNDSSTGRGLLKCTASTGPLETLVFPGIDTEQGPSPLRAPHEWSNPGWGRGARRGSRASP